MKLLLDTCVWGGAVQSMRDAGYDTVWTGEWAVDPGDEAILHTAYEEGRILVTLDKDFGERAVVFGEPHHGIVRLVGISARRQGQVCLRVLAKYGSELEQGAIVTVDERRTRVRLAD